MPISNGDSLGSLAMKAEFPDSSKALEILEKEYPTRDGLDIDTLLDSDKHGALTYNDFLVLPGYVGTLICSLMSLIETDEMLITIST